MFSPPKLKTIATAVTGWLAIAAFANAQEADYNRRLAAMQQARQRGTAVVEGQTDQPRQMRIAARDASYDYTESPTPQQQHRVAQASANLPQATGSSLQNVRDQRVSDQRVSGQRVASSGRAQPRPVSSAPQRLAQANYRTQPQSGGMSTSGNYRPAHLRTAQLHDGVMIDGGSPVVGSSMGTYETVIEGDYIDGGYSDGGGCSTCGDSGGYFESCDSCSGRGGCPDGPCWLSGLGNVLYNGDYFAGAQGFQNQLFANPGANNAMIGDGSFGFYGGMNFGIPLCRLTCGVLSGQLGVRSVQSNFNGNQFSAENRDQTFLTAGFYRRVDYGLQGGVVADILHEDWFAETDTVQIRTDLGWVWPSGTTFGFRYADSVQDDVQPATINGTTIPDLVTLSQDYYRFYLRHEASNGGYGEMFFGWTDASQTIFGMDADMPITDRIAAQATFTYYQNDDPVPANSGHLGGNLGDAWNVAVGFAWHPQGRSYYRSYDRPLFNVADNGTMLITRQ